MRVVAPNDPAVCCACGQVAFGHALHAWRLVVRPDAQQMRFALCPDCSGRLMPRLGCWLRERPLLEQRAPAGRRRPRRAHH
jgi:hypothetical protein